MIKWVLIGAVVLIVVLLTCVLSASGVFLKSKYNDVWDTSYYKEFDDVRKQLIAHGILAANGHNMQPWKFVLSEDNENQFDLYVESERLTTAVDPDFRQLFITQGTLIEYMVVSGKQLGYNLIIDLFPDGYLDEANMEAEFDALPIARFTLEEIAIEEQVLYPYMFMPDTIRSAYVDSSVSDTVINTLMESNDFVDLQVSVVQDEATVNVISTLAMEAATIETNNETIMAETDAIFRSNEYQKNKYMYGFSFEGQGSSGFSMHLLQGLITIIPSMGSGESSKKVFLDSTKTSLDNTPAFLMITSESSSRETQIEVGRLYSRLVLLAHHNDLAMQPVSQAIQVYEEMLPIYNELHQELSVGGTIWLLVRLGKPTKSASLSMRQTVELFIVE